MNTSPLYLRLHFFLSSACLTIPVFSPLPHSSSPSLSSLALSAWSADWIPPFTIHPSPMQRPTRNWFHSLPSFGYFFFVCQSDFSHVSRLSHACSPSYGFLPRKSRTECRESRRLWHEERKKRNYNLTTYVQSSHRKFLLILCLFYNLFLIKNKCEVSCTVPSVVIQVVIFTFYIFTGFKQFDVCEFRVCFLCWVASKWSY